MTYTYEDELNFIVDLYCPARQIAAEVGCSWELILAQAAQETGWGKSVLPGTNNLFNIKADAGWHGPSRVFHVDEEIDGKKIWMDSPFRIYPDYLESLRDRIAFLKANHRYAAMFDAGVKGDMEQEAATLQQAHFATDPHYATKLVRLFHGPTMRRAIGRAQKRGCGPCLPVIEVFVHDGARTAIANAKVNVMESGRSADLVTDAGGSFAIKIAPTVTGPLQLKIFDDQAGKWIDLDPIVIPTPARSLTVTLIAPSFTVPTATCLHQKTQAVPAAPTPAGPVHRSAAGPAHAGVTTYPVAKGDTLGSIAARFQVRYKTIADLNNIQSPYVIRPGQTLIIPDHAAAPAVAGNTQSHTAHAAFTVPAGAAAAGHAAQAPAAAHGAPVPAHAPSHAPTPAAPPRSLFADFMTSLHTLYYRDDADHPRTQVMQVIRAPWMKFAEEEFKAHVHRASGQASNKHVLDYFTATDMNRHRAAPNDEIAWCAAFANWCLVKAGFRGDDSAWAAKFKTWGRATNGNKPALGAVAVIKFDNGQHHVTFVAGLSKDGHRLATLGGNQGANHGVTHSHVPTDLVVCYRYPSEYADYPEDYILQDVSSSAGTLTAASTH